MEREPSQERLEGEDRSPVPDAGRGDDMDAITHLAVPQVAMINDMLEMVQNG